MAGPGGKNNAFNAVVIDELLQAIDRVGSDPQVRLLVLRGRGRHFCGGADLAWMQQSVDLDYQGNLADAQRIAELMTHLYNLPKPTLAVVQGAVFGGGSAWSVAATWPSAATRRPSACPRCASA